MQKKVIALAVAAIMAAPMAAQAGVEVYGKARLSVGFIGDDNATTGSDDSSLAVTSHNSRLGFKGSEDLGGGLKAVWQYERGIDLDNQKTSGGSSGDTITARNTFVGVAGGFGTVIAGINDTPYKTATGSLDPFVDSYGDYNIVISAANDIRFDNVIAYMSPDMEGFSVALAYASDIANDDLPDTLSNDDKDAISMAGMYNNGPLYVSLAYQAIGNAGGVGADSDAIKLGVGYKLPTNTNLGFVYESVGQDTTPTKVDQSNLYFSVSHPVMADTNVKFAYGKQGESMNGANDGGNLLAVGVSKNMTKNTELYALYSQMANDTNGTTGLSTGGGPKSFADKTASALAVGVNMNFSSM